MYCLCSILDFWSFKRIYIIFDHFRTFTKWSKAIFLLFVMIFLGHWCKLKLVLGVCCISYVVFLIFPALGGLYVIFGHIRTVTKKSKVFFFYSSWFCLSIVQVKFFWGSFVLCLSHFLHFMCLVIFKHLLNIQPIFWIVTK